ncbi:uncharacterized protein LOC142568272 [Dermacentor variabilis]|uniref:uncharacterized protein LOC142568272 n=1 Tax=Dermacentor variabilis TaxID=34621 RepID=UPI003F5B3940
MQRRLATDFATSLNKTTAAAAFRDQRQRPHTATLGFNLLVGGRNAARIPGSSLLAAATCRRYICPGTLARASIMEQQTAESTTSESAQEILVADLLVQSRRRFSLPLQQPRRRFTGGGTSSQPVQRVIPGDTFTSLVFSKPPPSA